MGALWIATDRWRCALIRSATGLVGVS